MTAGFFKMLF